jgi:hypothetical protein
MPLSKCLRCEKLFDKVSSPVCPGCQPDEDADIETVRNALDENPKMNAQQLSELSGVDLACVTRMIDSGQLAKINLSDPVKCGRCGAPALSATKKLCQKCLDKLNQELVAAQKGIKLEEKKDVQVNEYGTARQLFQEKGR